MGLRETIQKAVQSGFKALGNLKETVTYKYQGVSTYNTTTGTFTRIETSFSIEGVFMEFKKEEIDGVTVKPNDQKFLFEQRVLSVNPRVTDRLLRSDDIHWEVMRVKEDPAHATWELQVRTQNG